MRLPLIPPSARTEQRPLYADMREESASRRGVRRGQCDGTHLFGGSLLLRLRYAQRI